MQYESVKSAAERLGVTARAIQKWAASGKISGAKRVGKPWLIPVDFEGPEQTENGKIHSPMPLLNAPFSVGHCMEYIDEIAIETEHDMALAEYYYFRGEHIKSSAITEKYLNHPDVSLSICANALYAFANIGCGRRHLADYGLNAIKLKVKLAFQKNASVEAYNAALFFTNLIAVLMHIKDKDIPLMYDSLEKLPKGLRIFGAYILAHKAYLNKDYRRALGIADIALALPEQQYPLPKIYLHLIAAVSLINTKHTEEARKHFNSAVDLAKQDGFFQPFAEHHGLLQGLIEATLRWKNPEIYNRIILLTESFSGSWRYIHNEINNKITTVSLTPNEFSVAMLYSRGWKITEIATHLQLSERTVKRIVSDIYEKLDITSKAELSKYMIT